MVGKKRKREGKRKGEQKETEKPLKQAVRMENPQVELSFSMPEQR